MYLVQLSTISASITAFQAFVIVTTTWQVFRTWRFKNLQDMGRGVSDLPRSETNILWAPAVTPRAEKDQCLSYDIRIVTFLFWHFFLTPAWTPVIVNLFQIGSHPKTSAI
jgi:hypothetical protein